MYLNKLTSKNGRLLFNGKTFAQCSPIEQRLFNRALIKIRLAGKYKIINGEYLPDWKDPK